MKGLAALATFLTSVVFSIACQSDPPLDVAKVDLSRFQGKWYEIAKLPRVTQTGCEGTTAVYTLRSDTELDVMNECLQDGHVRSVAARAVVTDPETPAKLSLDVGAFFGDYWIVDIGKDYDFAVVGHPTREYLWILSRTPKLPEATLTGILERARDKQFDVSRLEYTVQPERTEPPMTTSAPPRDYGCAVSRKSAPPHGNPFLLVALLFAARLGLGRRRARP